MNAIVFDLTNNDIAESMRAHAWRGQYIDAFGRVEFAISEMLQALADMPASWKVGHAHLLGQRIATMDASLERMEQAGQAAEVARQTLAALREHEKLRGLLAHGRATIKILPDNRWRMSLRQLVLRSSGVERVAQSIDDIEAATLLDDLRRIGQALGSQLGQVRRSLKAGTPPSPK